MRPAVSLLLMPTDTTAADRALLLLLRALDARSYRFVTPTPATQARVLARPAMRRASDLRGVFGWSLPFAREDVDPALLTLMEQAGILEAVHGGLVRSALRVSSLGDALYLHSAYPTRDEGAVFFGPDSYRFAQFVRSHLGDGHGVGRLADIGAGSGVGAIEAARHCPGATVTLIDVNPAALRLARINAAHARVDVDLVESTGLADVVGDFDLVIANPPYIVDPAGRTYRDGGGLHGGEASLDIAREAMGRLTRGGRLLLYTGAAIVDGRNPLAEALEGCAAAAGCTLAWRELDPDVFGEELSKPVYADVERIAVIGAVATRR